MNHQRNKYGYSYDNQHRLTAAYYQLPGSVVPDEGSFNTSYSYDENGNMSTLERFEGNSNPSNPPVEIDHLDYTYDQGNRLLKVKDATNNPAGFDMNGAHTNDQYAYDDYGNLKTDPYKKISHITYNHLNLPVKITFTGGESMEYTYLAVGTKIEKTATDSENNTTTTEYRDGFQYQNNILEFFPHAEGYVKSTESVNGYIFNYVFTHTDHLGNIRIKYTQHPQTGEIQILEEDHYYPYGLAHKGYSGNHQTIGFDDQTFTLIDVMADETDTYKYKFNGMEWQDEFDVNLYDFGARNYDPALGRWMNIDPLAEMMRRHSPYNYAFNNPVYFIDPDGMSPLVSMASMQTSAVEFYDFSDNGGGNSGGEGGDPPVYNGPSVATGNALNPLPAVDLGVVKSKNMGKITKDGIVVYGDKDAANDSQASSGIVRGLDRGSVSVEIGGADINPVNTLLKKIIEFIFSPKERNSGKTNISLERENREPDKAVLIQTKVAEPYDGVRNDCSSCGYQYYKLKDTLIKPTDQIKLDSMNKARKKIGHKRATIKRDSLRKTGV